MPCCRMTDAAARRVYPAPPFLSHLAWACAYIHTRVGDRVKRPTLGARLGSHEQWRTKVGQRSAAWLRRLRTQRGFLFRLAPLQLHLCTGQRLLRRMKHLQEGQILRVWVMRAVTHNMHPFSPGSVAYGVRGGGSGARRAPCDAPFSYVPSRGSLRCRALGICWKGAYSTCARICVPANATRQPTHPVFFARPAKIRGVGPLTTLAHEQVVMEM